MAAVTIPVSVTDALKWFDAASGAKLPDRILVLPLGRNDSVKGPVVVSEVSRKMLPELQKRHGFDRVAIDFEHNTVPDSPEFKRTNEPRAVAGYGTPSVTERGLELLNVEWTARGRESAADFPDLSPSVLLDAAGNVTFVHSVALCRNGAVFGATNGAYQCFSVQVAQNNEASMAEENKTGLDPATVITVVELAAALGLKNGDKTAVLGRLTQLNALQVPDLTPLNTRVDSIDQQLKTFSAQAEGVERTRLVNLFATDGKVPLKEGGVAFTSEELAKLDISTLKILHANTPKTVNLSARQPLKDGKQNDPNLKGRARMEAAFDTQNAQNTR